MKKLPCSTNRYGIMPWLGTRALNTLRLSLEAKGIEIVDSDPDWVMLVAAVDDNAMLYDTLREIKTGIIEVEDLPLPGEIPLIGKYGECVPQALVRKQYIDRYIDIDEMQRELGVGSII